MILRMDCIKSSGGLRSSAATAAATSSALLISHECGCHFRVIQSDVERQGSRIRFPVERRRNQSWTPRDLCFPVCRVSRYSLRTPVCHPELSEGQLASSMVLSSELNSEPLETRMHICMEECQELESPAPQFRASTSPQSSNQPIRPCGLAECSLKNSQLTI